MNMKNNFMFLHDIHKTIIIFDNIIRINTFHMRKQITLFLSIVFESFSQQVLNNAFLSDTTFDYVIFQSVADNLSDSTIKHKLIRI